MKLAAADRRVGELRCPCIDDGGCASMMVAALVDDTAQGEWAREQVHRARLVAPEHFRVEVASVLRRMELRRDLSIAEARSAHDDLLSRSITVFAYPGHADRVWELRNNLTPYDACYVALAEQLAIPLATIDARLRHAAGPRCEFIFPSPQSGRLRRLKESSLLTDRLTQRS